MDFKLFFTDNAKDQIELFKTSGNKSVLKKIFILIEEITKHPYKGIGKPEALKYSLTGCWSRKINKEHRLVYEVVENKIYILSVKGHY
ncbi:MAG: Txe/YoeB family addiction module toxin [Alphaproteobacteria bacterium]|nr:Txe/YoeB family addiction module toxin [Alphaproteobacteria bacterium]